VDLQFKRRSFIIIIVVAALLVIVVPLWLKHYRADTLQSFTIPSLPVPPTAELLPMTSNKQNLQGLLNFPVTAATAWVIELPDVKDPVEAENLVQSLRLKGFNAYSRQYKSLLGVLTRVFVGPEIKPEQMKRVVEQLNNEMHLETKVVAFDPLLIK
jgi:cell division septation protein DedD